MSLFDVSELDSLPILRARLRDHYRGKRLTASEFAETLERVVQLAYGPNAAETVNEAGSGVDHRKPAA